MDSIKKHILFSISAGILLSLSGCNKDEEVEQTPQMLTQPAVSSVTSANSNSSEKNNRDLYPDLNFIEAETIRSNYLDYTIVDVRSNYEYRVLRMADSISIPANDKSFDARLRNLVRKHKQTVVLYGNGGKERIAHDSARKAKSNKIENVLVFDGDIMSWAETSPELTELNSKPINEENPLIAVASIDQRSLAEDEFINQYSSDTSMLLDIRDDAQTNKHPLQSNAEHIPLDHQVDLGQFLNQVKLANKPLFIYDNHGLKVRWLMYQLDKLDIENYYFLKDGVIN